MTLRARRPHKYGAKACVIDGVRFASQKEAAHYAALRLREKAGDVTDLELQPRFPIYVCRRKNGELVKVCDYVADFRYREGPQGLLRVDDVKGYRTPMYRLKRRMVEAQYGITVREV